MSRKKKGAKKGAEMPGRMDEVSLVKVLLDIPLFEDLDYTQVTHILKVCRQRVLQPGEVICESRTIDDKLIIFLGGKLNLETAEGNKLAEMAPVRVVGEMGVFTGQTRSSRVVAAEPSTILELPAADLEEMLEEDPHMGYHMMVNLIKLLYERVHDMNEELRVEQEMRDRLRARLEEVAPEDPLLGELFPEGSDGVEG